MHAEKNKERQMKKERPGDIYIYLLLAAIIAFTIGVAYILSDLYWKVGELDHEMMHLRIGNKVHSCGRAH